MRITTTWLETRQEPRNRPENRYDKTVDGREGLMVRVFPSGAVSFRFRYTNPSGRRRVITFGEFGEDGLSLADAFHMHNQAQRELEKDLDPEEEWEKRRQAQEKERQERAAAGTVADIVEKFVHRRLKAERWDAEQRTWVRDRKAKNKPRKRPDEAAALLKANLVDAVLDGQRVGQMKFQDLTRRQMIRLLEAIVDRGSPIGANRVQALFKQLCEWAANRDLIPASPMAGVEPPGGQEQPRKRKLTENEIRIVWEKLDTAAMAETTRLAIRLLLVTAQRRGELTFAEWGHFDLQKRIWTIPPELQKTEGATKEPTEPHVVPLSELALDILVRLKELAGNSRWVLPSQYQLKQGQYRPKKDQPYSERALTRAVAENEAHFGIPHWRPHDLRRTASSHMTKLRIPRLHVEKVLNHATEKIAEIYDRHDYYPEKRVALENWATHLLDIISGKVTAEERQPVPG